MWRLAKAMAEMKSEHYAKGEIGVAEQNWLSTSRTNGLSWLILWTKFRGRGFESYLG